ncbi:tether containing UBX domain for GLUT4, partial [Trifolium pratense]
MRGGDVGECQSLLRNIFLQAHSIDRWQWRPDPIIGSFEGFHFSRGVYCLTGCPRNTIGSLWDLVRSWIGIPLVDFTTLCDHFVQFAFSAGGSHARRSFLQLIWLACVWVVWTGRNHQLFTGSAYTPHILLDKIK